jgi:hypothetical protein
MPAQNLWRIDIINRDQVGNIWHTIESLVSSSCSVYYCYYSYVNSGYHIFLTIEYSRIWKVGHHSDTCTFTVIDLLCNPSAYSFSSPAP